MSILLTPAEKQRWARFLEFTDALRKVCDKYHAAILHTPHDIRVVFQEEADGEVHEAGVILGLTPGRAMYAHPSERR